MRAADRVNTPKSSCFEHDLRASAFALVPRENRLPLFRIMLQAPFLHCKIKQSVTFRCRGKLQLQCIDVGTCGRTDADSCARVTPYCSVWAVGYDISCGGT